MERIINKVKGFFTVMYVDKDYGLGVIAPHPAIKAIETSDEKIKIISGWMDSPYTV